MPSSEQEKNFQINWSKFWSNLTEEFGFLKVRGVKLPPFPETLFNQVTVDFDELKELLDASINTDSNKRSDSSQKSESKFTDMITSTWENFKDIDLEKLEKIGVNLNNGKIIYHKWKYLSLLEDIINEVKVDFYEQVENEILSRFSKLEEEKDRKLEIAISENPTTAPRIEYQEALNQLKAI